MHRRHLSALILAAGLAAAAVDRSGMPQYVVNCGGPDLKPKMLRNEIGPTVAGLARKITLADRKSTRLNSSH